MARATSSWNNLLATLENGDNKEFLHLIRAIERHNMRGYVKVPSLFTSMYRSKSLAHRDVHEYKRRVLNAMLAMLNAMDTAWALCED